MGFGRGMLEHWTIDSNTTYLNHGTVGVVPRRVLVAQQAIRDEAHGWLTSLDATVHGVNIRKAA